MAAVSFHFHGYQPGDLVRWLDADPLAPPRFEERMSPVTHAIGGERVRGRNWTDAVLRAYGRMVRVLEDVAGAASVDIEPQTLAWLLERDEGAYRRVLASWERGVAGLVMTPPFHPILPHHHRREREALFDLMIDFYAPLLRRRDGPVGLWLPECAYSADAIRDHLASARRAAGHREGLPDLAHRVFLIADRRQLAGTPEPAVAWHRLGLDGGLPVVARDPPLSGEFAFGATAPERFADAAAERGAESLLVASDLESLLANPAQADRFEGIVEALRTRGLDVASPAPPDATGPAQIVDYSSWSDYEEHLAGGRTSDTRWTGLRRSDGLVVHREHRGRKVSQLWKHGFTLATEQVETAVRRAARDILGDFDRDRRREVLRRLAVAYGRHVLRAHYLACGLSAGDVDFARSAEGATGGRVDGDVLALLARGYVRMLMGLRSDPRFWDHADTRVTFQGVACLAQALVDVADALRIAGRRDPGERTLHLLRATLLEFSEAYGRAGFSALHGIEGWETTEPAWLASLQSEVPSRSAYDVVRRATLYAAGEPLRANLGIPASPQEVVADTGHIAGEIHGAWENPEWCEHRSR